MDDTIADGNIQRQKLVNFGRDVPKADNYIRGTYIALICISVVEFYSASSTTIKGGAIFMPIISHVAMLLIGLLFMFITSRINYRVFKLIIPAFALLSVLAMLYTMFFGDVINGARRSFYLFGFMVQPPEFIKLSSALLTALIMAETQLEDRPGVSNKGIVLSAGVILIFGALLFSDGLTNTILMMAISLSVMLIGGIGWKKFMYVLLAYAVVGGLGMLYKFKASKEAPKEDTTEILASINVTVDDNAATKSIVSDRSGEWKKRWNDFFGPGDTIPLYQQEITSKNAQKMYSYLAQAHGGVFGVMPGNSRENTRLPLVFSDYIYALIIEDFGLIGGIVVLLIYLFLFLRAGDLSRQCKNAFPKLLIIACATMIIFQALFHMSIVTGAFPVSGQQLPLISRGGTSIIITSIAFGIMLSVTRFAEFEGRSTGQKKSKKKEKTEVVPDDEALDMGLDDINAI